MLVQGRQRSSGAGVGQSGRQAAADVQRMCRTSSVLPTPAHPSNKASLSIAACYPAGLERISRPFVGPFRLFNAYVGAKASTLCNGGGALVPGDALLNALPVPAKASKALDQAKVRNENQILMKVRAAPPAPSPQSSPQQRRKACPFQGQDEVWI